MDKPFRVERIVVPGLYPSYGTAETSWAVLRTGEGTVCTTKDVSWAYLIVAALNQYASDDSPSS